ncbi:hypothetical protein FIBSPDRAFT_967422 [Athelia psychrophila]|uniref:Uncharacterized protein n=1 Tax=Athelia psychrophila TaxID=1759441 RepID=A0A167VR09_9AGAM|nr:hypothetical protein FIBSPDRAFT_967422 [Fibularhizoctonia sp. CBS 109695]
MSLHTLNQWVYRQTILKHANLKHLECPPGVLDATGKALADEAICGSGGIHTQWGNCIHGLASQDRFSSEKLAIALELREMVAKMFDMVLGSVMDQETKAANGRSRDAPAADTPTRQQPLSSQLLDLQQRRPMRRHSSPPIRPSRRTPKVMIKVDSEEEEQRDSKGSGDKGSEDEEKKVGEQVGEQDGKKASDTSRHTKTATPVELPVAASSAAAPTM